MPVVHSSASVFSTEGVFTSHGPSSKVSTTSLSRRKSRSLKCSKPKPGPPVVSISTVRPMPSAFGLLQGGLAGAGAAAGAAWGAAAAAAAPLAGGVCDHAAPEAISETAPAKINPAVIRILISSNTDPAPGTGFGRRPGRFHPNASYPSWSGLAKATAVTTRGRLVTGRVNSRIGQRPRNGGFHPCIGRFDGFRERLGDIAVAADQIFVEVPARNIL